jgi:membrane-associated phospholipid phosphatase
VSESWWGAATAWRSDLQRLDLAVYAAVAGTPTPALDAAMRWLAQAADRSRLNIAAAALIAVAGGPGGRRAARDGLASVAVTSAVVNALLKPVARRHRPDRELHAVPFARHVAMPRSRSLPSGHAASAFALTGGVGHRMPRSAAALRIGATAVAYSRVHTGVHYPGDVLLGALLGSTLAQCTTRVLDPR